MPIYDEQRNRLVTLWDTSDGTYRALARLWDTSDGTYRLIYQRAKHYAFASSATEITLYLLELDDSGNLVFTSQGTVPAPGGTRIQAATHHDGTTYGMSYDFDNVQANFHEITLDPFNIGASITRAGSEPRWSGVLSRNGALLGLAFSRVDEIAIGETAYTATQITGVDPSANSAVKLGDEYYVLGTVSDTGVIRRWNADDSFTTLTSTGAPTLGSIGTTIAIGDNLYAFGGSSGLGGGSDHVYRISIIGEVATWTQINDALSLSIWASVTA